MKVELLKEIGKHKVGAIVDIEASIVIHLERDGYLKRVVEVEEVVKTEKKAEAPKEGVNEPIPATEAPKVEAPIKKRGNPNFAKKK